MNFFFNYYIVISGMSYITPSINQARDIRASHITPDRKNKKAQEAIHEQIHYQQFF